MATIIIIGPQSCGKTKHAAALMQHFGSNILIDDWDGATPLVDGTLALTNCHNPDESLADHIYSIDSALTAIQNQHAQHQANIERLRQYRAKLTAAQLRRAGVAIAVHFRAKKLQLSLLQSSEAVRYALNILALGYSELDAYRAGTHAAELIAQANQQSNHAHLH